MSKVNYFFKLYVFSMVFSVCNPAHAAEKLLFDQKLSTRMATLIEGFTGHEPDIARTDLNEDGMDEFIVRKTTCLDTKSECTHQILAETNNKIIELGRINARYLMLGTNYDHGIRNILAFKDMSNDYDYDVYVWEPEQSQYILLK